MTPAAWLAVAGAAVVSAAATLWLIRTTRHAIRTWFERSARRAVLRFRTRLDRYNVVS